jgi:isopentenyl phosphate kinase
VDMDDLVFLKLGGSLITDKMQPYTPRLDKLDQVAFEIKSALSRIPGLKLILGHGSGSFGHYAVKEQTSLLNLPPFSPKKRGENEMTYWKGFSEVWFRASQLNRFVMEALNKAGIPAIAFPPSALVSAQDGTIQHWDLTALQSALHAGLVPVIYGDIVFDAVRGGVVLSTEKLLFYLAQQLPMKRVLLAGLEAGVWADFPARLQTVKKITPSSLNSVAGGIGASHGMDVTGGMRSKVEEMLGLVQLIPKLSVQIFSGEEAGNVEKALRGEDLGTLIAADKE